MNDEPLTPEEKVELAARNIGKVLRDEDRPERLRRRVARVVLRYHDHPRLAPYVDKARAILGEGADDEEVRDGETAKVDEILKAVSELSGEGLHRFVHGLSDTEAHVLHLLLNARLDD